MSSSPPISKEADGSLIEEEWTAAVEAIGDDHQVPEEVVVLEIVDVMPMAMTGIIIGEMMIEIVMMETEDSAAAVDEMIDHLHHLKDHLCVED